MQYAAYTIACALLGAAACRQEPTIIVKARCSDDIECGSGFACEQGECLPREAILCQQVEGGLAILQPSPARIDFGFAGAGINQQQLLLRNIGNCTVTVFEADFERGAESPFECPFCTPERFPIELFPFRDHALSVFFTPEGTGTFQDVLRLLSDDSEFGEIRIPVRAHFNGVPAAAITPDRVDFDFIPVGRSVTRTLDIRNRGTGIAPLEVRRIVIESPSASAFSVASALDDLAGAPVGLHPLTADTDEKLTVRLRYRPQEVAAHTGELVIFTNQPAQSVLRVPLEGSSKTPAKIAVSRQQIEFGLVPLGQTTALPLTIINEGGTPLRLTYRWSGTGLTTDLSALPPIVTPIPAGRFAELLVLVTATSPGPIEGLLILESNDPARPTVTIQVSAEGQEVSGAQVVKIDMNFENGEDGFFDEDFRNVDLTVESPFGLIVNKQFPDPDWDAFGTPSWLAFGPKEEPERIVLPNAQQDGVYRVLLTYQEDCASVPAGLVAAVLGISVEALVVYLSGGSNLGIGADDVSSAIEGICFDRTASNATVTIYVNGSVVAEVPATLSRKSETLYVADLIRENGQFSVRP